MSEVLEPDEQAEQDLAHGQIVIITARWILIVGALVLALWGAGGTKLWLVQVQVGLLLVYAVVNFFLHAQYLKKGPGLANIVYLTSLIDLALVTIMVLAQRGITSNVFVFYFPALLAISVAFARPTAVLFVVGGLLAYAVAVLIVSPVREDLAQMLISRLVIMVAVAFCGNVYQRIESDRREGKTTLLLGGGRRERPSS